MDFDLSEEQRMLKRISREFLTAECPKSLVREMERHEHGYSPELWSKMADLGWPGLVIPVKYGGTGGSFVDLIILLEEMGRACVPGPFSATVLGGMTVLNFGSAKQKQDLLHRIAQGQLIMTLALSEPGRSFGASDYAVEAVVDGDNYVIDGTKLFVPDAHVANYLVCACMSNNGIAIFLVQAKSPNVNCTLLHTMSGDKQYEVTFDRAPVPKESIIGDAGNGQTQLEWILQRAAVAKCAEMIGGAQKVLEMTVDYVKQRIQFGQPIGAFQAIQHHCSNMATKIEVSRFLTYQAAWTVSEDIPCKKDVSIAKARVSDAYRRVTLLGHQSIGGVGLMEDHDLPLYSRRAKAAETCFGSADFHREVVAQELGL